VGVLLVQVLINATGRDTDHTAKGIIVNSRTYVLGLEYGKTFRVSIEKAGHESVLFDFVVIDNQAFLFHMKEAAVSIPHFSFIQMMLQKLLRIRQVLIS
jgi:hypothetical protein